MLEDYRADSEFARALRLDLVDELVEKRAIGSAEWKRAFAAVPRHVFVPRVFLPEDNGVYEPLDGTDPRRRERWLRHVYTDDTCVTQLDGDDQAWERALAHGTVRARRVTCASPRPSLMAGMLRELDLTPGDRVLEIGTGTGYGAALLCERVGADHVTSVDTDPVLVDRARSALASLNHTPELAVVDAGKGLPRVEGYGKLIATTPFSDIPAAWLDQVNEGGAILAGLFRPLEGGILVSLTVSGGRAVGGFSSHRAVAYTPVRDVEAPSALDLHRRITEEDEESATAEPTELDAFSVLRDAHARFFIALASDLTEIRVKYPAYPEEQWLLARDGSWACVLATAEGFTVKQGGKRNVWEEFVAIHREWHRLGRPRRNRFGLTVTKTANEIWLDSPENLLAL